MRPLLFLLIVVVLVLIVAMASGFLDVSQIRGAKAPSVSASSKGITAKGGQAPAFDVQTGSVQIGTRNATVTVPDVKVVPPGNEVVQNSTSAM